jgi:phosphatidylglycerophosphate synthase
LLASASVSLPRLLSPFGGFAVGLLLFLLSRIADGLDGAVARATMPTDQGGFLDIALDFFVYAAIPLAFAVYDPSSNAFGAGVALAILAEKSIALGRPCHRAPKHH